MTPTREELFRKIAELIGVTQDLVRATEESRRESLRLRADIARLTRRPRAGSGAMTRRSGRSHTMPSSPINRLRLLEAIVIEGGRATRTRGQHRQAEESEAAKAAAIPSPPAL